MVSRFFLIPMEEFPHTTGRFAGLTENRPKYIDGLGLTKGKDERGQDAGARRWPSPQQDFALVELFGHDVLRAKQLDQLAAMPDVEEIPDTDEPVAVEKLARTELAAKNIALARKNTGRELVHSLRQSIMDRQAAERVKSVRGAVRDAIRG